ncbi:MAG TPA: DUF1684 domain-containing protein, partial [Terrimesophilobacter sp.]|nr:DUF1684 domain-containing protein [Terrimesophilobacter sp.]
LRLTARADDGIRVNGELVDGEVVVAGKDSDEPGTVVFSDTRQGFGIAGPAGYALRVWDAESEAIANFGGIDAFDHNPDWVVAARFTPTPGATVPFEHVKDDDARELDLPGEIAFTKDGIDYTLAAIQSGRALQLVFSDTTSGDTTYSVGRFL